MPPADPSVMMEAMGTASLDSSIVAMPRGGPDASCLDRLLQTDRPEYLDRESVDAADEASARSLIEELAAKLLANPVIEDFKLEKTEA